MKKVTKLAATMCLVATTSMLSVFASNTKDTTQGTIRADQDNYIDLNYYNDVQFEKGFGFTNLSNSGFQLGGATKVKDNYLGAHYSGNFWGNLSGTNDTIKGSSATVDKNNADNNENITASSKEVSSRAKGNTHNFSILYGLKDMGFLFNGDLSFRNSTSNKNDYNTQYESNSDKVDSNALPDGSFNTPSSKSSNYDNNYKFSLKWGGKALNAGKAIAKPSVKLGFDIYHNTLTKSSVLDNKDFNKASSTYNVNSTTTKSTQDKRGSYTNLEIGLGSEFMWGKGSNFMQALDVSDNFGYKIYSKDKSIVSEKTVDTINLENNKSKTTTVTSYDKVNWTNNVYTNYRFEYKPVESLTLGFIANLNTYMSYNNPGYTVTNVKDVNSLGNTTITETYSNGTTEKESIDSSVTFKESVIKVNQKHGTLNTTMNPSFGVGLSYAVKPNFKVNLGYSGTIPSITVTDESNKKTTTTTKYDPSTKEVDSVTTNENNTRNVSVSTGNYSSSMSAGIVWGIGKYCTLDVDLHILERTPSLNTLWTAGWRLGFSFKM